MAAVDKALVQSSRGERRLRLARAAWLVAAALALAILLASIPGYVSAATVGHFPGRVVEGPPGLIAAIDVLGVAASFIAALACLGLATLLYRRRPADPMALFVAFYLLAFGCVMAGPMERLDFLLPGAANFALGRLQPLLLIPTFLLLALFPDGRFVPRWSRWLVVPAVAWGLLTIALPNYVTASLTPVAWASGTILALGMALLGVYAQAYRYRRVSGPAERQQTKWFIFGMIIWIAWLAIASVPYALTIGQPPDAPLPVWRPAIALLWWVSLLIVPLSLTVAVLRYRLYDIDVVIHHTLVYGALSAALIALYTALVGGASLALQQGSQLAALLLTAVLALILFRPVEGRLQLFASRVVGGAPGTVPAAWPAGGAEPAAEARGVAAAPVPKPAVAPRRRVHYEWVLAVILIVLSVAATILSIRYALVSGDYRTLISHQFLIPFVTTAYALLGALVLSRLPRHPIGWTLLAVGVFSALNGLSVTGGQYGPTLTAAGAASLVELTRWLGSWAWLPIMALAIGGMVLLFPDGRLPSRRWRLVAWPGAAGLVAMTLGTAFHPGPLAAWDLPPNPYGIPAAIQLWEIFLNLGGGLAFGAIIISLAAPLVRYRRARGLARLQMKWMVYAVALTLAAGVVGGLLSSVWPAGELGQDLSISVSSLSALGIAVAAALAILRYRVYDIDLIINRTLVYGALTAMVVAVYVLLVGALGTFVQARNSLLIGLVATGIAAVLFQPLRDRLQRSVNRLVYGERDDPYSVLAGLGRRLESVPAAAETLGTIVQTVAQMLKLPYAGLTLVQGEGEVVAADYGRTTVEPGRFPLVYQGETIGHLLAGPRAPGERFTPAETQLLEDVAHQAAVAAQAARLSADLQQSRERLVTAREEERRRLRRDLHDGLGPALAGLMLKVEAAKDATAADPAGAEALLSELKTDIQGTLTDVRRLVYNLRPPALDEFGLAGAMRDYLLQGNWPASLCVTLEGPESLPPLPAAVEVAAYRVVQEAVTNVVRHAQARHCTVRLGLERDFLQVQVEDDGRGLAAGWRAGVGITAMRERAAELGGSFAIEAPAAGGTRLVARLPIGLRR